MSLLDEIRKKKNQLVQEANQHIINPLRQNQQRVNRNNQASNQRLVSQRQNFTRQIRTNMDNGPRNVQVAMDRDPLFRGRMNTAKVVLPQIPKTPEVALDMTVRPLARGVAQLANQGGKNTGRQIDPTKPQTNSKLDQTMNKIVFGGPNSNSVFQRDQVGTFGDRAKYNQGELTKYTGAKGNVAKVGGLALAGVGLGLDIVPGGDDAVSKPARALAKAGDAKTVMGILQKAGKTVDQGTIKKLVKETDAKKIGGILDGAKAENLSSIANNSKNYDEFIKKSINTNRSIDSYGNVYNVGDKVKINTLGGLREGKIVRFESDVISDTMHRPVVLKGKDGKLFKSSFDALTGGMGNKGSERLVVGYRGPEFPDDVRVENLKKFYDNTKSSQPNPSAVKGGVDIPTLRVKSEKKLGQTTYKLNEVLGNNKFNSKYPELGNLNVHFTKSSSLGNGFDGSGNIVIGPKYYTTNGKTVRLNEDGLKTIIHEVEHAKQLKVKGYQSDLTPDLLAKQSKEIGANQAGYFNDPKEIGARNAEAKYLGNYQLSQPKGANTVAKNNPMPLGKSVQKTSKATVQKPQEGLSKSSDQFLKSLETPNQTNPIAGEVPGVVRKQTVGQQGQVGDLVNSSGQIIPNNGIDGNVIKTKEEIQNSLDLAHYNAENKKGLKEVLNRFMGARANAKITGAQIAKPFNNIDPKRTRSILEEMHGVAENGNAEVPALKQLFSDLLLKAKQSNPEIGQIEDYFPQYWKETPEQIAQMIGKKGLGKNFKSANPRSITFEQGIDMGLTPRYNTVSEYIGDYVSNLERSNAGKALFEQLKQTGAIVGPEAAKLDSSLRPIVADGFPRAEAIIGDGKTVIGNYYAPKNVAESINRAFSSYSPDTAFEKTLRGAATLSGKAQEISLSGGVPGTPINFFGLGVGLVKPITSGRIKNPVKSFGIASIGDTGFNKWLSEGKSKLGGTHLDTVKFLNENGVVMNTPFNVSDMANKGAIKNFFGDTLGDKWHKALDKPTFQRLLPAQIVMDFEQTANHLVKGGMPVDQAKKIALEQTQAFHSVSDYATQVLRDPRGQDAIKAALFAPKYREQIIKFWGNNVKAISPVNFTKNEIGKTKAVLNNPLSTKNRRNTAFMAGAVLSYLAYDQLNMKYQGNHLWENPEGKQDKLLIPVGEKTIGVPFLPSVGTLPRMAFEAGKQVVQGDILGKEGAISTVAKSGVSMAGKTGAELLTNSDYFGNEIYNEFDSGVDKAVKAGGYAIRGMAMHPYAKAAIDKTSNYLPDNALKALGAQKGKSDTQLVSEATEMPIRWYDTKKIQEAPIWKQYENQKKVSDLKSAVKSGDISQDQAQKQIDKLSKDNKVGPGFKLDRTNAKGKNQTVYTNAKGEIKFADDSDKAQIEMAKSEIEMNGGKKKVGDTLIWKSGDKVKTKKLSDIQKEAESYKLDQDIKTAKDKNNLKSLEELSLKKIANIREQMKDLDPEADAVSILRKEAQIEAIKKSVGKYKGQGYIKKGKKAKKPKIAKISKAKISRKVRKPGVMTSKVTISKPKGSKITAASLRKV